LAGNVYDRIFAVRSKKNESFTLVLKIILRFFWLIGRKKLRKKSRKILLKYERLLPLQPQSKRGAAIRKQKCENEAEKIFESLEATVRKLIIYGKESSDIIIRSQTLIFPREIFNAMCQTFLQWRV
jgi:ArsR family metal-binding transcriptional regulator